MSLEFGILNYGVLMVVSYLAAKPEPGYSTISRVAAYGVLFWSILDAVAPHIRLP